MPKPKRTFASIHQQRTKSKRWQVRYTGPDGVRRYAPHTFDTRLTAEAWVVKTARRIDKDQWDATDDNPREAVTFGAYSQRWLANRQVSGRPIKARTREHYQQILDDHLCHFGTRQLTGIKPKDVRDWYTQTLIDRPTMRAHAYSLLRTIMASAINDELIDTNPCRIPGAGQAKRVHRIRPASITELAVLTEAMPDRLRLMVTLASWCALRFGEIVELRRGDVDLFDEVIRVRRAAVRVSSRVDAASPPRDDSTPIELAAAARSSYQVTTPKSDAGIRDVAIPPHIVPAIEAHLAKYVDRGRDSLLFPANHGGHLQPSTLYGRWYKAREAAGRKDLRWHDLRHSGAVLAAATGATLAELMQRLGHSTPQAAMRYQHAARGRDREIAALLSKLAANRE